MSVAKWNCHSSPLHVSSNVKLPDWHYVSSTWKLRPPTCQYQSEITMLDNQMSVQGVYIWIWTLHLKIWVSVWTSFETGRVYLTAYLGTASENLNSHLILVTSSDKFWGGISESEHFIWKFGSQCALHLKLRGVYLTADLGTASENLNSHLILVTSSDNFWGGKFWNYHFDHYMSVAKCNCHELDDSGNMKLPFLTTRCQ